MKRIKKTKPALWTLLRNKPVNAKARRLREYSRLKKQFLKEQTICVVALALWGRVIKATDVHHTAGRVGKLLTWVPGWVAVSRIGHSWVHNNIEESRRRGWIAPVGSWNRSDQFA